MKEEIQQYNTRIINTITALDSNYFVFVKVKVVIHTIFLFMKASKTEAVNMEFHICIELMAPYFVKGIIFLQNTENDICIELMAPLLCQGYHLFKDIWYTAVSLAESSLLEGINLTDTVCSNRKYLPAGVKKKLAKSEVVAFRKNRLLCMGWQDKKHVILISTEGSSKMITYTIKRKREHQVPEIV